MSSHPRKACKECGEVLTLRHFYPHPTYRDGRMNICKECKKKEVSENRELKYEYYQEQKREIDARPESRERRRNYARSERGRAVHRAANIRYRRFRKLEARA